MKVFHKLEEIAAVTGTTSLAIGNFDGIHLGHQALLRSMLGEAKRDQLTPTVLTFYPHPVEVLRPGIVLQRLTTGSEKLAVLEDFGVNQVLVAAFDSSLAQLSPDEFFKKYLVDGLRTKSLHVGFDFSFGKNRQGTTETLKNLCLANGIRLHVQTEISITDDKVSSSLIRKTLSEGKVEKAATLLGRPYRVTGHVQKGDGRGRKLGFPTANIHCSPEKLLPANGVYVTRVLWQKQVFQGVANIGTRPTFKDSTTRTLEVHILDFNAMIYDEFLDIDFTRHLRPEKKFNGIDELVTQIKLDIEATRR